jgi:aspartate/methionine/tyrosine aminotransferase
MIRHAQAYSNLTDLELKIATSASLDVGPGYPQVTLPAWLDAVCRDVDHFMAAYAMPPVVGLGEANRWHDDLLKAACRYLRIDEGHARNGFATFSGSLALDRAIASQLRPHDAVVTTQPSIDIVTAMVRENPTVEMVHVPTDGDFHVDVDGIDAAVTPRTRMIAVTSPENPTGAVLGATEMKQLVELAVEFDLTLLFDQCFASVNPFGIDIPLLPDYAVDDLRWIFIWDTGKTFGLNEEKLGFIFCSDSVRDDVQGRMNVTQFGVSRRQKLLFREILDTAPREGYDAFLSDVLIRNFEECSKAAAALPIQPLVPEAASMLLFDVSDLPGASTDADFADRLLDEQGVGVVKVRDFFYPGPDGEKPERWADYVRMAMARNPEVVTAAMDRIAEFCESLTRAGAGVTAGRSVERR